MRETLRIPDEQKPRKVARLQIASRPDGSLLATLAPEGDYSATGAPLGVELSARHFSTIKAQGETGMVFQDMPAFDRWLKA